MRRLFPGLCFAVTLLTLPGKADENWNSPHDGNPILSGYYADPSLLQYHGKFYLYATLDPWGGRTLGCWESADFKSWTFRELNWPTKEACASPTSHESMVWAPSVVRAPNGKFFMYVSVGSEVWVGTADQPLGPWRDAHGGKPLVAATWNPTYHMIDAEGFIDDDGQAYLYWGSGWDWKNGHCFAVRLKSDLVTFDGEPRDVTPAGHYFEGPFMVKHGGKYFLMNSFGKTVTDTYCVYAAVGDNPLGPFTEQAGGPILSTDKARNIVSPGHHAVFTHDGHTYILYHRHSVPYVPEQAFRQTCVDELDFTADGLMAKVIPTHRGPPFIQGRQSGALAATATASSQLDEVHSPACVLDDNYATRWAAAPGAQGSWLQLDLASVQHVARSELRFEYAWKPYHFMLTTSQDGEAWTPLLEHKSDGPIGSPFVVTAPVDCRYLRLVFADCPDNEPISVIEWSVR
jgi:beta-xylosidase